VRHLTWICVVVAAFAASSFGQQTRPARGVDLNTGGSFPIRDLPQPPREWIDKDTGHRIVRLTDEPGSESLYFNDYSFSPDGKKMVYAAPDGIHQLDLATRSSELILAENYPNLSQDRTTPGVSIMMVGRKTGRIFFTRSRFPDPSDLTTAERSIWWIDPATKEQHEIATLPKWVNVSTVNSDETMLAGAITYYDGRGGAPTKPVRAAPGERIDLNARWRQHLPMALVTMNVQTGEIKTFNPSNDWDNHFQFSPTDAGLLMYCHEGPWQNNDRVWIIRTDGTGLLKVHERTMINEIWGHEFWAAGGHEIWYQLQTPRGEGAVGWIAGYNLATKQQTWLLDAPNTESIHVNVSPDGSLFAGDGIAGSPWIFLFRPHLARNQAAGVSDASHLIQPGTLEPERLVNMSNHLYAEEPNATFTPDMKWIIFRSNMFGPSYVYAVEIAKAK
jgi:oligogalacturonide lyase